VALWRHAHTAAAVSVQPGGNGHHGCSGPPCKVLVQRDVALWKHACDGEEIGQAQQSPLRMEDKLRAPCLQPPHIAHLQHARVAAALVVGGRAKVHGARDVGGAAVKLPARVHKQQRAGVHRAAGAGLCAVMDDCAVGAGACGVCVHVCVSVCACAHTHVS